MAENHGTIVETLRLRLLRALELSSLAPGDRLPSARELAAEFKTDSRAILAAYRELVDEGLVEIRRRGGVYVGPAADVSAGLPIWAAGWLSNALADGLARGIPATSLADAISRSVETLRLHALAIASTEDQAAGLARELRDDFGLVATGFSAADLHEKNENRALSRADIFIATEGESALSARLAAKFDKPHFVVNVRPDFIAGEWAILLRQPIWAVVATPEFGAMLTRFFERVNGAENLHILVHGSSDLSQIPQDAPTYLTHRVRELIGDEKIRGKIIPPGRMIAQESAKRIFDFIVKSNIRASQSLR